jgi:DNA-binding transcriptional ArsR family regulator
MEPTQKSDRSPPGALKALVGFQRATLLAALEQPRSVGELDEILHTASGGATYHVRRLEAAGVVTRRRRGQRVIVELTGRGESLLVLFGRNVQRLAMGRRCATDSRPSS